MEFKDLFEFFAAFGAVGSAALSYQAVMEMKRQREANFKPELILGKSDPIFIYGAVNSQINIPFIISQNEDQRNNFGYDDDIYISLYNIGAAPAKNVRINWNCNYAKVIEMIKTANVVGYFQFNGNTITTSGGATTKMLFGAKERDLVNYVINSSTITDSFPKIPIPHLYIFLAVVYQMCGRLFYQNTNTPPGLLEDYSPDDFPLLYADFEFSDLHGATYHKKMALGIRGYLRFSGFPIMNQKIGELSVYHYEMPNDYEYYESFK